MRCNSSVATCTDCKPGHYLNQNKDCEKITWQLVSDALDSDQASEDDMIKMINAAYPRVDLETKDPNTSMTLLMKATNLDLLKVVQKLIDMKAKVDAVNDNGVTSLMLAASLNHYDCAKALVIAGADVDLKNNFQSTALLLASSSSFEEMA
jgi:ankyrin repeat protein